MKRIIGVEDECFVEILFWSDGVREISLERRWDKGAVLVSDEVVDRILEVLDSEGEVLISDFGAEIDFLTGVNRSTIRAVLLASGEREEVSADIQHSVESGDIEEKGFSPSSYILWLVGDAAVEDAA